MLFPSIGRTPSSPPRAARFRHQTAVASAGIALIAISACGSPAADADEAASDVASLDEVASLDAPTDGGDTASDAGSTLDADEAALAFSECLREQGLDVPDIGVDGDGNIDLRDAFEGIEPGGGDFREATQACGDLLGDANFGGGRAAGGFADNTAIQDALVELTECVRDAGFPEATEVTFGQPGQATGNGAGADADGSGGPAQRGQGQGGGPGQGDIGLRFAGQMGLDADDPEVIAAMETCTPILDEAFTEAGLGGPGQQADG
ncbi:hypothetical protein [Ilumatobacter coccineus]|uniref:Uncharacterized protein n=1 Tax=Ilumatobacter coccineus (strain NBRC 103263 / KCTC 29153 / YM16-304) TaxID=1313172 RepID=A0A6C7EAN6_ILUCY|nr:hypothetical protein [Ilumatobacter coccineus]BAN03531.1 hypothetical protein YM304_32170 [Ilumatobacter coccineus YM16-304]